MMVTTLTVTATTDIPPRSRSGWSRRGKTSARTHRSRERGGRSAEAREIWRVGIASDACARARARDHTHAPTRAIRLSKPKPFVQALNR
jgi:hypothetical protein